MSETMIVCPRCGESFAINEAIQSQIASALEAAKNNSEKALRREFAAKSQAAIAAAKRDAAAAVKAEIEASLTREREESRLALAKARQEAEFAVKRASQEREMEAFRLKEEAAAAKAYEQKLRAEQLKLMAELNAARRAGEDAKLQAERELMEKQKLIRAEAERRAAEEFNTKIREQAETINRLREQVTSAKQVAEQGSQQLQGEILELDLEAALKNKFPQDTVTEVKKGERGADVRQVVQDRVGQNCGLILWECKNAKTYQNSWLAKLKDELAEEKAQMGVIVFQSPDADTPDFSQLTDTIWLVRPKYALILATLVREILVKVATANRAAEGKDVKVELIYQYLTGGEFNHRIRYLIESYDELTKQLELEKKQAQKRWAAQEKIIQKVTGSLYGISGDLEGIVGKELIALPENTDELPPAKSKKANKDTLPRPELFDDALF